MIIDLNGNIKIGNTTIGTINNYVKHNKGSVLYGLFVVVTVSVGSW